MYPCITHIKLFRFDIERERGKNDYKLLYFDNPHTQYDVGIPISDGFRDVIKEVERFDDRLMKLAIMSADRTIHYSLHRIRITGRSTGNSVRNSLARGALNGGDFVRRKKKRSHLYDCRPLRMWKNDGTK